MSEAGQYKLDRPYLRLALAATLVVGGLLLYLVLKVWFGISLPYFITFYPAVMVAALFSGYWYGLFSTLLSGLLVAYFIMQPVGSFRVENTSDTVALVLFAGMGTFMSVVAERYRRYQARIHVLEREHARRESEEQFRLIDQQTQEALRVSRERLALAVEIASMGEWELDFMNNSGSRSPRHKEIFGYPADDTNLWNFDKLMQHVLPECREEVRQHLNSKLASDGEWEIETQIRRLDGEVRWIWSRGRCETGASGRPLRAFGIVIDITDRKLAEQALLRSEKLASVGRMAASIAHEINNPLEAVGNLLYLARCSEDTPAQARRYLEMADAELKQIAHITRQSLGFYRENNSPAPTAVTAVMESAIELLDSRIKKKHAVIEKQWNGESELVAVAGELRQVFANLLANSLDAIDTEGTIKIRIANGKVPATGELCVRITIADNGRGIPEASRKHLFEPFFTTKGSTGTGLGLWVSKQIVDKHEGTIRMRSLPAGPRHGTAFSIVLPANKAAASTQPN